MCLLRNERGPCSGPYWLDDESGENIHPVAFTSQLDDVDVSFTSSTSSPCLRLLSAVELRQWISHEARSVAGGKDMSVSGGKDMSVADLKFLVSHAQQQVHALTRTLAVQREAEGGSEGEGEGGKPVPRG